MPLQEEALTLRLRVEVAVQLSHCRADANIIVPELIKCFDDPQPYLRWTCAQSLGRLQGRPDIVIPSLIRHLDDVDWRVRRESATALGKYKAVSSAAVQSLTNRTNDTNAQVSYAAIAALGRIDPQCTGAAVKALINGLDDNDGGVRWVCAMELAAFGKKSVNAVDSLQRLSRETDSLIAETARRALDQIASGAED